MSSTINKLKPLLISLTIVVTLLTVWAMWEKYSTPVPSGSVSKLAEPAPVLRKAPTVKVPIKAPVATYQGQTKANLKLPAAVIAAPEQQVIAAAQVKSDLHPQTVSTVINTETGKVETFAKADPYPVFAIETRGEITTAYGYKIRSGDLVPRQTARLQIKYDVVRVKAFTIGAIATLDNDRDTFVGIGVSYKW